MWLSISFEWPFYEFVKVQPDGDGHKGGEDDCGGNPQRHATPDSFHQVIQPCPLSSHRILHPSPATVQYNHVPYPSPVATTFARTSVRGQALYSLHSEEKQSFRITRKFPLSTSDFAFTWVALAVTKYFSLHSLP
jgi:hypothetical protein